MLKNYFSTGVRYALACMVLTALSLFSAGNVSAQVYEPEAINMPGSWNGYTNYPNIGTHFAFRGHTTVSGSGNGAPGVGGIGKVRKVLGADTLYRTLIHAAASGGDVVGGAYNYLFTAGSPTNAFQNKWASINTIFDSAQTYVKEGSSNNNVTLVNGDYYTVNFNNNGYVNTPAIWMKTSAPPVNITAVSQSPLAGSVTPSNTVDVTITLSAAKSAEEKVYVRYSTNSFSTSSIVTATGSGTTYTATIPAQPDGSIVGYYAFTSTLNPINLKTNLDIKALRFFNAAPGTAFTYTSAASAPVMVTFRVDMANSPVGGGGVNLAGSFNGFSTSANPMTQVGSTSVYETQVSIAANATIQYKFVNGTSFEGNISAPCGNGSNRTFSTGTTDDVVPTTCFSVCGACPPQHAITFTVDMNNEAGTTTVAVAGSFNGFSTTATPLTQIGTTGVWSTTINLVQGNSYAYKFIKNGNFEPNIPVGPCNTGGQDRTYTVGTGPASIATTCYSSCGACTPLSFVTFQVDMKFQTVIAPLQIRGTFNSFGPGDNLTQVGSTSVWQITKQIAEGTNIQYKFYNGNFEASNGACFSFSGNRGLTVPTANTVLPAECYSTCGACPAAIPITFNVNMANETVTNGVVVSGNFNGFNTNATPLTQIGSTGVWTGTAQVPANSTIDYKFVNGIGTNNYENNFVGPCKVSYNSNRGLIVGSSPVSLPTVCFNRCIDCNATNVWLGSGSNFDYNNGGNWSAGTYVAGSNVQVRGGTGINPMYVPAGTISYGNVDFVGGGVFSMDPAAVVQISGNITGNSNYSNGTLELNGASPQTIAGTHTVNNLTVSNNATLNGTIRATGTVSVNGGANQLNVVGGLTLASTASGTARIAPLANGLQITGPVTQERYVGGAPGWYFVGAPAGSSAILTQWSEISPRIAPLNNANIFYYTENDTTSSRAGTSGVFYERDGWKVAPALSSAINPSNNPRGYRMYLNNNFMTSRTLSVTGPLMSGAVTVPVTKSANGFDGGGYNLISNPYASNIDFSTFAANGTNGTTLESVAFWIWNTAKAGGAGYSTWSTLDPPAGAVIPSSQAFFVRAASNGTLSFAESNKTASAGTFLRSGFEANTLRVNVGNGTISDYAMVGFRSYASNGADRYDASKLDGTTVNVSTGTNQYANVLASLTASTEVPVKVTTPATGAHTFSFEGIETFDAGTQVYLRDRFLNRMVDLVANPTYAFDVTGNAATQGADRFTIVFAPNGVTVAKNTVSPAISVWPNPANAKSGQLNIDLTSFAGTTAQATLIDMAGKVVTTTSISTKGGSISTQGLQSGVYTLKVQGANQTLTQRVVVQ